MLKKFICLSVLGLFAASVSASADTIFTLNSDGCSGTCGTGPFATVDLSQTSTHTVTVTETLSSGVLFAGTGAGQALEFNVIGPVTIGNITSGFEVGPAPATASAFGSFLESVSCERCRGGRSTNPSGPLSFTVTSTGFLTIADFVGNSGGYYFASDIVGTNGNAGNVSGFGSTPPPPSPVPEPSSLLLFGTGLIGSAGIMRRRIVAAVRK